MCDAYLCVRPCKKVRQTLEPHTMASGCLSSTWGIRKEWSGSVWLQKM